MKCVTVIRCALAEISMDHTVSKVMPLKQLTAYMMRELVEQAYNHQPSKYHKYMTAVNVRELVEIICHK